MDKIHIVGTNYSFTHLASRERYGDRFEFISHLHGELVDALLQNKIPKNEASVVPMWNSNSGPIDMDQKNRIAEIFLGRGGEILDLWAKEIFYSLGIKGIKILKGSKIYSVKVASDQCSKFLKEIGVYKTEKFIGEETTTAAADLFIKDASDGDGLLCSKDLLSDKGIKPNKDNLENPFNMTIFSTINSVPISTNGVTPKRYSLGCILTDLNGNELPSEFIDYWHSLFSSLEAEKTSEVLLDIPKILFILRFQDAKALLLLEMPIPNNIDNPWPIPDREPAPEIESLIVSCEQVGKLFKSFIREEKNLLLNKFTVAEEEIIFYGIGETFIWGAPALNIFVHGFDPKLIQECVWLQILHLKSLMDYGIPMEQVAKKLLMGTKNDLRLDSGSYPVTV